MKNLRAAQERSFWVTNITNMNICLSDLALTIPARRSMNLLDKDHFVYTLPQLEASAINGSLFKKRDKIRVRNNPPEIPIKPGLHLSKIPRYIPSRSAIKIQEKIYEELLPTSDQFVSEEKFAEEFSTIPEDLWNPKKTK
jgi:hypothetical protein